MAGGTWTAQNKVRPGIYINFRSAEDNEINIGTRGTVAICEPMSWGPVGTVQRVPAEELLSPGGAVPYCGYDITAPQARFLREILKGTDRTPAPTTILLYRPAASSSAQAEAEISPLTVTAKYPGARGNGISIAILAGEASTFTVNTIVDGDIVDSQTAATADTLVPNDWVEFSGTGALSANSGTALSGGADGTVQAAAYTTFLQNIEPYRFDILIYDGSDTSTLSAMADFVKRLCEEEGQYCQLCAAGFSTAPDSRYVIEVASGAVLEDGTTLTPQQVCWWAGGAQAGAGSNQSLTYASYPGAADVSPRMTSAQIEAALRAGKFLLFEENGRVRVEEDINSLTTFTADIHEAFHKNRVMRLCNAIANDLYTEFSDNYIGVVNNNETGRGLFKSAIVSYLLTLQDSEAIQNFDADDVEVLPGQSIDSIVINLAVQPVDAVEKIYMTVTVM